MLSHEDNERLTRVGAGTAMGELMRRYWHPVATSEQLPGPDCDPLRIKLLGERYVAFRDTDGKVGVLDELCMHRGASLAIGRVEEGGIRCLYHGWKFAVDGTILETPNHADCRYRERKKAPAYPVVEQGGLIWTYVGPKEHEPPFRTFASDLVPDSQRVVLRVNVKANYLQLWEGGLDSSHVSVLHTNQARPSWARAAGVEIDVPSFTEMNDTAPKFEIEDTWFGYHYAASRNVGEDRGGEEVRNIRIVPAIMPHGRIIPGPQNDFYVWETPDDDYSTSTFIAAYSDTPFTREYLLQILGLHDKRFYDEQTCNFLASWDDGFLQDRAGMRINWTGFQGIEVEDAVTALSYGPLFDRSKENLVTADMAVVRLRRRMLENVRRVEAGEMPLGVDVADMTMVAAPAVDVPASTQWQDLAPFHRQLEAAE
jgi:nitrite reductase/ring-hydroxylating ferredoxin subunit